MDKNQIIHPFDMSFSNSSCDLQGVFPALYAHSGQNLVYVGIMTFVHLVFQVENRYHSAGRARRFFHSVTMDSNSVVPRLFAIVAEQQRKQLVDAAQR